MAKCWETRPCDDEMASRCPHNEAPFKCPARCNFAECTLPTHQQTSDPALVFDPFIDRGAAVKESCTFCAFFLTHGPKSAS